MLKPLSVLMLLFSIFSLIWLKSSVVSTEYMLSTLEKKKESLMRERKMLNAERAHLMAIERFQNAAATGLAFPDRVKVVWVMKAKDDVQTASYSSPQKFAQKDFSETWRN